MSTLIFRTATEGDLDRILGMLADDPLGKYAELTGAIDRPAYVRALKDIQDSPLTDMIVGERIDERGNSEVLACLQLTLTPSLSRGGARRALVEAVRVASDQRGQGIGTALLKHAIGLAHARGAKTVQLTSDTRRTDAHRFYKNLGFSSSHAGFKLDL
ncbi:MAG: GNAT family N-acetyltransferase [Rhodospirillaceae bacterium]|nr:GNAT family N-acetyltransferase [Rhodospirillaceae bacterium]